MRRALLLACLAWAVTASAQVPTYVPTDGLVGWFPMDGNITNEVNGAVGNTISTTAEPDRNGQAGASLGFNGAAYGVLNNANMPTGEFTISTWVKQSQSWSTGAGIEFICVGSSANTSWGTVAGPEFIHLNRGRGCSGNGQVLSGVNFPLNEWVHLTYVCAGPGAATEVYLNGAYVGQSLNTTSGSCGSSNLYFGVDIFSAPEYITGGLDDIGIWNRALSETEVTALFTGIAPVPGCTEETACNYDTDANVDDGSCIPSGCMEESACNYNADAECEGEACDYSCCPGPGCCGDGMHWDSDAQTCVITPPSVAPDAECMLLNLQELAEGYQILLAENAELDSLLADCNGTSTSDQSGPCSGEDVVTYHGYDYDIVEIGDQCWFAENLRTTTFSDDLPINADSESTWPTLQTAAYTEYGAGSIPCDQSSTSLDVCTPPNSAVLFGYLYNWHAVSSPSGLCPSGWHVPTILDTQNMFNQIEAEYPNTLLEEALKSETSWNNNGTNISGFNGKPGGWLYQSYNEAGTCAGFWTSSMYWTGGWTTNSMHSFYLCDDFIYPTFDTPSAGLSVRCVKD